MTREEFSIIVKGLKAVYTDPRFIPDKDAFDVWYAMLSDLDYKVASLSTQKYIMSNKFMPSVSDIRSIATEITKPQAIPSLTAWSLVSKAIRDSAYHAQERFDAFPEEVKLAVGSPENLKAWGLSENFNENVAQSHFIKAYETVLSRKKATDVLPDKMKDLINGITEKQEKLIGG